MFVSGPTPPPGRKGRMEHPESGIGNSWQGEAGWKPFILRAYLFLMLASGFGLGIWVDGWAFVLKVLCGTVVFASGIALFLYFVLLRGAAGVIVRKLGGIR